MITRPIKELHFIKGRDPLPTVEVQAESLEDKGLDLGQIVSSALTRFAKENPTCRATVYLYGTMSVNFHASSWSEFLIVAGDKKVLEALHTVFASLQEVNSRYSDYVAPSEGIPAFHVEDGLFWEPEDVMTWYSASADDAENDDKLVDRADDSDKIIEGDSDGWDDIVVSDEPNLNQNQDDALVVGRAPEQAARYRTARADASVSSIRQKIEEIFGLPEGSVALCGPDGRALRGDAFIKTLRRRWADA